MDEFNAYIHKRVIARGFSFPLIGTIIDLKLDDKYPIGIKWDNENIPRWYPLDYFKAYMEFMDELTFNNFQQTNYKRFNSKAFGERPQNWSLMELGCAAAGELGELCNLLKKEDRDSKDSLQEVGYEIADVITYLSLIASKRGINLQEVIREKFNKVSDKWGSDIKL